MLLHRVNHVKHNINQNIYTGMEVISTVKCTLSIIQQYFVSGYVVIFT